MLKQYSCFSFVVGFWAVKYFPGYFSFIAFPKGLVNLALTVSNDWHEEPDSLKAILQLASRSDGILHGFPTFLIYILKIISDFLLSKSLSLELKEEKLQLTLKNVLF